MRIFTSHSTDDTHSFGRRLASLLEVGDLVLLTGDLGAGKTIMSKGIAKGLGVVETVTSPTFAIANVFRGRLELNHLDVYRFDSAEEVYEAFDISEMLESGVVLVEWGELIQEHLGDEYLEVKLSYSQHDSQRTIELKPLGEKWLGRLSSSTLVEGIT